MIFTPTWKAGKTSPWQTLPTAVLAAAMLAAAARATAQQVLVPAPPSVETTTPLGQAPSEMGEGVTSFLPHLIQSVEPSRWAPIHLRPHLSYTFEYGNGIQSSPGEKQNTIFQELSPGALVDIGKDWHLDYTPSLDFYSSPGFQDTVNHRVFLNGATSYDAWTFNLSQSCDITSYPLIETASQTSQQLYATLLGARYVVNSSTFLDLEASQDFRFVDQTYSRALGSSLTWSTTDWVNHNWGSKLAIGLGPGFGYTLVQQGSDLLYEELQGRVLGQVTPKLSLMLSGGAEIMEFVNTGTSPLLNPIFSGSINYQPFAQTLISLTASERTGSSYYQNEVSDSTLLGVSLRQRLLGMFFLTVSGGYANTAYTASTTGVPTNTGLNYEYVRVALSKTILKRGEASIFWSNSSNTSNQQGYGYSSDQVGFTLAYRY